MKRVVTSLIFAALLFAFSPVFAQNHGTIQNNTFGLTFFTGLSLDDGPLVGSYETEYRYYGIGVVYHPLSFLAVEAGLFYKGGESEYQSSGSSDSRSEYTTKGFSVGLYYYHEVGEGMYIYAGPRFERADGERTSQVEAGEKTEEEWKSDMSSLILGVKYLFNNHIGIFADIGIGRNTYNEDSKTTNNSGVVTSSIHYVRSHTAISRSLIGVVFYF